MADDKVELLHVNGETFYPNDLSYGEMREVRAIIRKDLWDADLEGDFDWKEVHVDDVELAMVVVFMRRSQPKYKVEEAMNLKSRDVYGEDEVPPTSSKPASARKQTSAKAGAQN
jgi:hypothetical protein